MVGCKKKPPMHELSTGQKLADCERAEGEGGAAKGAGQRGVLSGELPQLASRPDPCIRLKELVRSMATPLDQVVGSWQSS